MKSVFRQENFNSQPHKEADGIDFTTLTTDTDISTHSLTRRLTRETLPVLPVWWHFNSQPHKEADYSAGNGIAGERNFNSQPHKEADFNRISEAESLYISTHSLTRRLTQQRERHCVKWKYFNSQPHKEADNLYMFLPMNQNYFNSQPHKEADSNFRQKHIYPKLIFLLIIHISLIFYSNHHILNYFSCKLYVFPGANVLEYFCELTFRTIILRYL